MFLSSFQSQKHYRDYRTAKECGRLPDGSTLPGGLTNNQLMKKTAPDRLDSGADGGAGADELDKTGQLHKLSHDGLNLGEKAAKKGCACPDCRDKRAQNKKNKPTVDEQEKLKKKAIAKMVSHKLAGQLSKLPDTELSKAYNRTLNCANYHYVEGGEIHTEYCRCRWCLVCNRIRTAKLINTYVPIISTWDNPHMLTLTVPNCEGFHLQDTIERMQDVFLSIRRLIKRGRSRRTYKKGLDGKYKRDKHGNRIVKDKPFQGINFEALRKIEVTYNEKTQTYHPHFHIAFNDPKAAHLFRMEWLKQFQDAEYQAQDLRPIDKTDLGSVKELFKYFSKIFSTVKKGDGTEVNVAHVERLNVIFEAMDGKRTLQPYGFTKKDYQEQIERINLSDNLQEELTQSEIEQITQFESELKRQELDIPDGVYRWSGQTWKNTRLSKTLVDYQPSDNLKTLIENILIFGSKEGTLCNVPLQHHFSRKDLLKPKKFDFVGFDGITISDSEKCHQITPQTQIKSWITF